ncbi:MAG: DegT/DnrJ/EryC1/StrS family aminotransferase [Acidobacteriota bacterium]
MAEQARTVPFLELTYQNLPCSAPFLERVQWIVRHNSFVGGSWVESFEAAFARYCGVAHCVALNSGTDALKLGLQALGAEPDWEVVTSPFTFVATAEAVAQVATLAFCDVDPETFTMSPAAAEQALGPRTRALIPVHIFGLPADLGALRSLAGGRDLKILEDACQAHGAAWSGVKVGAWGDAAAFSFYPTKNLGGFGDGGALVTADAEVANRVRLLRNHGQTGEYVHEVEGWNSRLDALQAAALLVKLERLDEWNAERRRLAEVYREHFADLEEIQPQKVPPEATPVYHLFGVLAQDRDRLREYLTERGVGTRVIYPVPLHLQPAFRRLGFARGDFPVAERIAERVLCLPLYPGLGEDAVRHVAETVRSFYR